MVETRRNDFLWYQPHALKKSRQLVTINLGCRCCLRKPVYYASGFELCKYFSLRTALVGLIILRQKHSDGCYMKDSYSAIRNNCYCLYVQLFPKQSQGLHRLDAPIRCTKQFQYSDIVILDSMLSFFPTKHRVGYYTKQEHLFDAPIHLCQSPPKQEQVIISHQMIETCINPFLLLPSTFRSCAPPLLLLPMKTLTLMRP